MKVNRIMIVSLLLLAILAIGAASASEDVDTLDVEEVDDLSVDESSDIVTDGESPGTLETVGIYFHSDDSYPITEIDDKHVVDFDMPIDSNGRIVVSSGDKTLYNKEYNEIEHKWNNSYTSNDRKGLWINNYELNLNGLSNGDIVKFSFISDTSHTYSNFGKITFEDDTFRLEYLFDTWNWARGDEPLYLDTDDTVVNVHIMDPATEGTFYVSANGREYKYVPYYNEWGDAWHNWKLISFDITAAGQYPVVVRYAPDDNSPRDIIGYGVLNVIEFNHDVFRANIDTHNNINLFCPENREGHVEIYMKDNWDSQYEQVLTYDITSNDFNKWKIWNLADLRCEKENEYIFKIAVSGADFDQIVVLEDKSIWYNDPWDIYVTPETYIEVFDDYYNNDNNEDNIFGVFIPEKANVYNGTVEIRNGGTLIYSKDVSTKDMDFDDNSRDYRYWLRYKDIKSVLVNYNNAALTFTFKYNNTQISQPFVMVNVINKKNYEIELEKAFNAGIFREDWGNGPLYIDYNREVIYLDFRYPVVNGIFYITAHDKEYQYQPNFDEEGRAWHNWILSSFNITEAGLYPVTIEYADNASSPRLTVMEGELNVVEFNHDAFRIVENRPAQTVSVFCPDESEGSVISIFIKYDWEDDYPSKPVKTITVIPDFYNDWLDLTFDEMGLTWDRENIVLIKILNGDNEQTNPYESGIWYDYDPYEPFMPSDLVVNINGDDFRSENDEDVIIDLYIPENLMIYRGTVTLTSNERTIYSKEIALNNLEFDPNGRYYQLKIEFGELNLDGLNSGDVVKFAFTNDVKNLEKSVFYRIHHDEDDEYVNFRLINFKDGNFLDDDVLIEVADFPEGIDDEFIITSDKWDEVKEHTFKISELARNEEGFYVWKCSQLDIDDFMEDMSDATLRFVFKFSDGYEIEGHCWVYKDPCISWGEFGNTNEDRVIDFMFLPDEFEGSIIIRVNGETKYVFNSKADMDRFHYQEDSEDEEDEGREGWSLGLEDLGLYKQYGKYNISVEMTKNGEQVYYNNTIELVDYVVDARTNLDQITSAVFRILLDEDASGNVTIYVDGVQVFKNTLDWIGYSEWNRMGGFNIPLNYLQIIQSGSHDVRLEIEATDDREDVMTRTIYHNIHVEVAPNDIVFADIMYMYRESNFLYQTRLTSPVPIDSVYVLYLNGVEAGSIKIECDDFMFRELNPSLLDEYGALRPGVYNAKIVRVSEQGNETYEGSFEVKTSSGGVEVIVPDTVTSIDEVKVEVNVPRPPESEIDNFGLVIFIDPFINEDGELESEDIVEMWGWELFDYLENNPYIVLDSLSAGTHKLLVQYSNEGDDGERVMINPFFSGFFTVNVKKAATQITASAVTATYKATKNLVVTLKDANGRIIVGKRVTVKVGTITKTLTTNGKGQISVDVSSLAPKSYTATITFAGDGVYLASTKAVKVVVNKAKTKLTAKKVKVKVSVRAKKVTAILKFNGNKVLKSKYVTLKINKKTYKVKTNKKGQAIFKVKNLKRKGTFTGTLKFKGDKYFKASSCKVKVTVK